MPGWAAWRRLAGRDARLVHGLVWYGVCDRTIPHPILHRSGVRTSALRSSTVGVAPGPPSADVIGVAARRGRAGPGAGARAGGGAAGRAAAVSSGRVSGLCGCAARACQAPRARVSHDPSNL